MTFKTGDRIKLTTEQATNYVILSRRGDITGTVRKVGRKLIEWTTDNGVRLATDRNWLEKA